MTSAPNVRRVARVAVVLALLSVTAARAAGAEPLRLKPGLWEMHTHLEGGDARTAQILASARAQIAAMPPAQRRQVEQAMAGRGIELELAGDALTARVCITREMADRDEVATTAPVLGHRCRAAPRERHGDTVRFGVLCSDPRSMIEGSTTFLSDQAFESKTVNTFEAGGNTRMTTIEQTGRWIGADCAAVAPPARSTGRPAQERGGR